MTQSSIQKAYLFIDDPISEKSLSIAEFVAEHIDEIQKKILVWVLEIDKNDDKMMAKYELRTLPCLWFNETFYSNTEDIVDVLTKCESTRGGNIVYRDKLAHDYGDIKGVIQDDDEKGNIAKERELALRRQIDIRKKRYNDANGVQENHNANAHNVSANAHTGALSSAQPVTHHINNAPTMSSAYNDSHINTNQTSINDYMMDLINDRSDI